MFRGPRAWRSTWAAAGGWSEFLFVIEEYRDGGDTVVALGRLRGFGRGGGVPVESPVGTLFDLRGGRIWRMRAYLDHDEAIATANLQE